MTLDATLKDMAKTDDSSEMSWEEMCKWSLEVSEEMVNLAINNQSAWTRFYMDTIKSGKDTPAMMVELVDEMSTVLDNWNTTQREIWDAWFTAIKELEAVTESDEAATAPATVEKPETAPAPKKKATTKRRAKTSQAQRKTTKAAEAPKAPVAVETPVEESPAATPEAEAVVVDTAPQAEPAPQPENAAPAEEQPAPVPAEETAEQHEEYTEEKKAE